MSDNLTINEIERFSLLINVFLSLSKQEWAYRRVLLGLRYNQITHFRRLMCWQGMKVRADFRRVRRGDCEGKGKGYKHLCKVKK